MHTSLTRYKIGLLVLSVLLLVLVGYVIVSGASQRQDNITQAKAETIANKLNDYTLDKSAVPENLEEIKITDVPSTISYQKKSDVSYEFCATFVHASNDTPATSLGDVVSGAALGAYGASYDSYKDSSSSSYLTIGSHTKGKNCQTIEIYGGYESPESKIMETCSYDASKSDADNEPYDTCLDNQSRTQFN